MFLVYLLKNKYLLIYSAFAKLHSCFHIPGMNMLFKKRLLQGVFIAAAGISPVFAADIVSRRGLFITRRLAQPATSITALPNVGDLLTSSAKSRWTVYVAHSAKASLLLRACAGSAPASAAGILPAAFGACNGPQQRLT